MKNNSINIKSNKFTFLVLFVFVLSLWMSCSEDNTPIASARNPTTANSNIILSTLVVSNINGAAAQSGGNITSDGGSPIISRGVCWSTAPNPTIANAHTKDGDSIGSYTSTISGLTANSIYYVRAYATNISSTAYGNEVSFTSGGSINGISISTLTISNISDTGATCGGNITYNSGSAVIARGVCWSTSVNPTLINPHSIDGTGIGVFSSTLSSLLPGTMYFVRSYATNSVNTQYGNQISFTTLNSSGSTCTGSNTVSDIDGNVYNIVTIGNQCWMKENLKTTRYRNGTPIPGNLNNTNWAGSLSGAQADYNNNTLNTAIFGKLYNYYAVADPSGLCPAGWHVPTNVEWNDLVRFLDPSIDSLLPYPTTFISQSLIAGEMLKSTGDIHAGTGLWFSPNIANDITGFSAYPGGFRRGNVNSSSNGTYSGINIRGIWWSSTPFPGTNSAIIRSLYSPDSAIYYGKTNKTEGCSVRCVRD